jgi:hypothetical protein
MHAISVPIKFIIYLNQSPPQNNKLSSSRCMQYLSRKHRLQKYTCNLYMPHTKQPSILVAKDFFLAASASWFSLTGFTTTMWDPSAPFFRHLSASAKTVLNASYMYAAASATVMSSPSFSRYCPQLHQLLLELRQACSFQRFGLAHFHRFWQPHYTQHKIKSASKGLAVHKKKYFSSMNDSILKG